MSKAVITQIRREVTPGLYHQVRRMWTAHSIAEDRRDIPGLLATLTEDCRYELVPEGHVWQGHDGAARFYTALLAAFPDIHFDLQHIVIGPQGVWEEAHVTGTHRGDWLSYPASGRATAFDVMIFFPWDLDRKKFTGERVYAFDLDRVLRASS